MKLFYKGHALHRFEIERLRQIEEGRKMMEHDIKDEMDPMNECSFIDQMLVEMLRQAEKIDRLENELIETQLRLEMLDAKFEQHLNSASVDKASGQKPVVIKEVIKIVDSMPIVIQHSAIGNAKTECKRFEPHLPGMKGQEYVIRHEEICIGQSWDCVSSKPLTPEEEKWQKLYRLLRGTGFNPSNTILVFGWDATLRVCQEIFHHLRPSRLIWISTCGKSLTYAENLMCKITADQGQICIIANKKNPLKMEAGVNKLLVELNNKVQYYCKQRGIYSWCNPTNPHTGIECHKFADYMLNYTFKHQVDKLLNKQ